MLNSLFGSAVRAKLLNAFLLYPERNYALAALAKEIGLSPAGIRSELANLVSIGLLKEERRLEGKAEKKFYRVDESFLLYPEIKALFTKAQILFSEKFVQGLTKICQPRLLALTGLFTNYPEAQTDLLVVGSVRRPLFLKLLGELEKDLGREINFTILSEKEFNYRRAVMDIFLYNILEGKTIFLVDDFLNQKKV